MLVESIVAKQPFPPFQASIKDGYAVISQSLSVTCTCRKLIFSGSDKSVERDVLAPVTAGESVC